MAGTTPIPPAAPPAPPAPPGAAPAAPAAAPAGPAAPPAAPAGPPAPPAAPAGPAAPPAAPGSITLPTIPQPPVVPGLGQPAAPGAPAKPATPGAPAAAPAAAGAGTPGSGAILTFAMKAIEQTERKTLVFEYHRAQAVTRQYAPQSLIGMLLDDLTGPGHFVEVDLDDPFFRSIDVDASVTTAFEPFGLQSIAVGLEYGDPGHPQSHRHADLVFDAAHTAPQRWTVPIGEGYDLGYTPRIEYHFDPQSGWAAERNEVVIQPGRTEDRTLQLDPTQHIGFLDVDVAPDRLDPLEVAEVEVSLAHHSSTGWSTARTVRVSPGSAPEHWRVRTAARAEVSFTAQSTYHLVDGSTIVLPAVTGEATTIAVGSPFAAHLDRRIAFAVTPGRFASVVIDVGYVDGDRNVSERLEIDGGALAPARARIGIVDPTRRDTTTQATLLGAAGEVVRGAPFTGPAEFLTVADDGTITGA